MEEWEGSQGSSPPPCLSCGWDGWGRGRELIVLGAAGKVEKVEARPMSHSPRPGQCHTALWQPRGPIPGTGPSLTGD